MGFINALEEFIGLVAREPLAEVAVDVGVCEPFRSGATNLLGVTAVRATH